MSWRGQVIFQYNGDHVRFLLDQHALLEYNANRLKQQSAGRHVDTLSYQSSLQHLKTACLPQKQSISII